MKICFLIFCPFIFSMISDSMCEQKRNCSPPFSENFCFEVGYNPTELPPTEPIEVFLTINLKEISQVDDLSLTVYLDFSAYMDWNDSRVEYTASNQKEDFLTLSPSLINQIYVPDLYIYRLITFQQKSVFNLVQGLYLDSAGVFSLYFDGLLQMKCQMDFSNYPFDSQLCKVRFGSAAYTDQYLKFDGKFKYRLDEQRAIQYNIKTDVIPDVDRLLTWSAYGNYTLFGFDIQLHRIREPYFWQIYIPSFMFYIITVIGYVIPLESGERGSVLVTLLLVFVSMLIAIGSTSPKASTSTALDVWMITCIFFAFMSLVEFGIVLVIQFYTNKWEEMTKKEISAPVSKNGWPNIEKSQKVKLSLSEKIDRFCIVSSVVTFSIFCLWYWGKYV